MERLQRFLAESGVASRRHAEELIQEGRVKVDGQVVHDLGVIIDPERQRVEVDDTVVRPQRKRYLMLNKPPGYITTAQDERGRRTVLDLVQVPERVVPIGRLDRQTSGLLLLTNDGELAYRIAHPKFELDKEYVALLDGHPPPEVLERLRRGVVVEGERVKTEQVKPLRNEESGLVLSIVIHEGRNRIVRRMLDRVGYPAISLERVRIGPLMVRGLPEGTWRDLTAGELEQIFEAVGMPEERSESRPRPEPERRRLSGPPVRRGAPPQSGRPQRERPAAKPGGREERERRGSGQGQRPEPASERRQGRGQDQGQGERRTSGPWRGTTGRGKPATGRPGRGGGGFRRETESTGAGPAERRGPAPPRGTRTGGQRARKTSGGTERESRTAPGTERDTTKRPTRRGAPFGGSRSFGRRTGSGPGGTGKGANTGTGSGPGRAAPKRRPSSGRPGGPGQTGRRGERQQGGPRPPNTGGRGGPGHNNRRSGGGGQEHGRQRGGEQD